VKCSAVTYETVTIVGIPVVAERAWYCPKCTMSWYDDRECPRCNAPGEPEKLPSGAKIIRQPCRRGS
jgi:hypothetical protein